MRLIKRVVAGVAAFYVFVLFAEPFADVVLEPYYDRKKRQGDGGDDEYVLNHGRALLVVQQAAQVFANFPD
jgi:hypothetical protein